MARLDVYPIPSCAECGIQSAGKCPTCHRNLCVDHFPLDAHAPCSGRLAASVVARACYICGEPARPQQWSSEVYAHYVDSHACIGCHRPICDDEHTAFREEGIVVRRDGVRSHRYHVPRRDCQVCFRLRAFGGLIGAGWCLASVIVMIAVAVIVAQVMLG